MKPLNSQSHCDRQLNEKASAELIPGNMKIVLCIPACVIYESKQRWLLANSLAQLIADGHHVTVILGGPVESSQDNKTATCQQHLISNLPNDNAQSEDCSAIENAGRMLSAQLAVFKTCGIFLYGSDAGICRIRKASCNGNQSPRVEICEIDAHWIHIICRNGGVPILSNIVRSAWGEYYRVDSDEQAAVCAIYLRANLLLYLTLREGITDSGGTVLRWLAVEDIDRLSAEQKDIHAISQLNMCRQALENGVHRARMLPVSQLEHLAGFYQNKIEHGTEVIMDYTQKKPCLFVRHAV
jgi:acetylglutamate kinase